MYHIGKVLKVLKKQHTTDSTQAMVEFWDDNLTTLRVATEIEKTLKEGDFILADYYPSSSRPHNPSWTVIKILGRTEGTDMWRRFREFHARKTGHPATHPEDSQMKYVG